MTPATLDISEARKDFTRLEERLREDRVIWITRHSKQVFALVDIELMQAVLETLEILKDPEALQMLQQSLEDIRAGRLYDHEDVKKEMLDGAEGNHPMDENSQGRPKKPSAKGPNRDIGKSR